MRPFPSPLQTPQFQGRSARDYPHSAHGRGAFPRIALLEDERIEVVVTVKAYPSLSQMYGDVAGIRTDVDRPEWVGLFPLGFRDLSARGGGDKYGYEHIAAGLTNTTAVVASAVLHLGRNPTHRARLVGAPELIPQAVRELLRLYTPSTPVRTVTRDRSLEGGELHVGDRVLAIVRRANRDSRVFSNPDTFDPHRGNLSAALTFGSGRHACPAAWLATSVVAAAVRAIIHMVPAYSIIPVPRSSPPVERVTVDAEPLVYYGRR